MMKGDAHVFVPIVVIADASLQISPVAKLLLHNPFIPNNTEKAKRSPASAFQFPCPTPRTFGEEMD